ncbi:N-terminal nucleophile aminohydrolase [Dichomitus squalens]|uniref:N-terminal nucleophile aminohydrolase n=1 Tax=Dichomitus squalens TaxID=114155 RepID=A0A4Q9P4Z5_9APHY|nr:N-terminal nucleophile aminohydrolase [Dichomitus squalens]TBU56357.1 N-terminal nucleophile aminohydrolase [Dichomitus squalens]
MDQSGPPPLQIIAVHGGAGFHPKSTGLEVKHALRLACSRAIEAFTRERGIALPAVCEAISALEEDEFLNAGYGSNLTLRGTVECDASIMDGCNGDFGAVGSVSGVRYPIKLAHEVLQYSRKPDPLGRTPPLLLVSSGASEFAESCGLRCPPQSMVSRRAQGEWAKWKNELDAAKSRLSEDSPATPGQDAPPQLQVDGLRDRQDTVGAVACNVEGHLAAGVSSGGLLLKLPGRVGEAAIYGAGCWATHKTACSVSGAGEYITRLSLARALCDAIEAAGDDADTHEVLQRVLGRDFLQLCSDRGEPSPQAGVLLLVKEERSRDDSANVGHDSDMDSDSDGNGDDSNTDKSDRGGNSHGGRPAFKPRLWCAFTTESMAIGYATTLSPKPSTVILRRPPRAPGRENSPSVYTTALPLNY